MAKKIENLKKKIFYLLAILVILVLAYFIVYQKFVKTPEIETALLNGQTEGEKTNLSKMINDLFKDSRFSSLKKHGTLLPLSLKPKSASGEIEEVGAVGRPNPFSL